MYYYHSQADTSKGHLPYPQVRLTLRFCSEFRPPPTESSVPASAVNAAYFLLA